MASVALKEFINPTQQPAFSGRSRLGKLMGFDIASTGSYVPETIVHNDDLAGLGFDSDWIIQRTGILERRRAAPGQASSDLAALAAQDCLDRADVISADIDLIIVATLSPDHATPSTACHLQRQLGCIAPAFDVNAACAGFMYGMVTAGQFISTGAAKYALVVGVGQVKPRATQAVNFAFVVAVGRLLPRPATQRRVRRSVRR